MVDDLKPISSLDAVVVPALLFWSRWSLVERTCDTLMCTKKFWVKVQSEGTPRQREREMYGGWRKENGRELGSFGFRRCRTNDKLDSATIPKSPFLTLS